MEIHLLFAGLWGLALGRFLNHCIDRIPQGKSPLFQGSYCEACNQRLTWTELIPIFSFFRWKKACRWCQTPLSWRYPLIEGITGILFVLVWSIWGCTAQTLLYWIFIGICLVVFEIDRKTMLIPNKLLAIGLLLGGAMCAIQELSVLQKGLFTALGSGLFFVVIAFISRGGMGGGDIKFAAVMGLYLGPLNTGIALWLAFILGGGVAVYLLIRNIKSRKDAIPFGPFLAVGGILSLFIGEKIQGIYF